MQDLIKLPYEKDFYLERAIGLGHRAHVLDVLEKNNITHSAISMYNLDMIDYDVVLEHIKNATEDVVIIEDVDKVTSHIRHRFLEDYRKSEKNIIFIGTSLEETPELKSAYEAIGLIVKEITLV